MFNLGKKPTDEPSGQNDKLPKKVFVILAIAFVVNLGAIIMVSTEKTEYLSFLFSSYTFVTALIK